MSEPVGAPWDNLVLIKDVLTKYGPLLAWLRDHDLEIKGLIAEARNLQSRLTYLLGSLPLEVQGEVPDVNTGVAPD